MSTSGKKHILVVGSINTDLVVQTAKYPKPGETVSGFGFSTFSGGKGANQAVAAARLGASVRMIGAVGDDSFGRERCADLKREGVDLRYVKRLRECPTGVAVITVRRGENSIIVEPGANGRLTAGDVRESEPAFRNASVVLLQLETTLEAVMAAVELGKKHGARIILNPAPAPPFHVPKSLISAVDELIPNEFELARVSRKTGRARLNESLEALHIKFEAKRVIVTLGARGALISEPVVGRKMVPAFDVAAIDTTAAGDAFIGAYAVAMSERKDFPEAIEWGLGAGALAVTKLGAQPSLPYRGELERFLNKVQNASVVTLPLAGLSP